MPRTELNKQTQHVLAAFLTGYNPEDVESLPQPLVVATRTAGRALARAVLGLAGGPVKATGELTTTTGEALDVAVEVLAGCHAIGVLLDDLIEDGVSEYFWSLAHPGDPIEWDEAAPGADAQEAEALALALVRGERETLWDIVTGLLLAPEGTLTWSQVLDLVGEERTGARYVGDEDLVQARADLTAGRIEPITPGWGVTV